MAASAGHSPKLTYDYAAAWAGPYSRGGRLKVLVQGAPERPDALMALSVEPSIFRIHRFICNDDGGLRVPCRTQAARAEMAAAMVGLRAPMDLGYYPADDPLLDDLAKAAKGRAKLVIREQDILAAPWLELDETWIEPTTHLSKNTRHSIRRSKRRLSEGREVSLDLHMPNEAEVDALLDITVGIEAKSWKQRTGTSLDHDKEQTAFFRAYGREAARAGRLQVALLMVDGEAIAMSIGEIREGIFWAYKISYDEAWSKFGPGVILQHDLISALAKMGLKRMEFQGQLVAYKRNWTDQGVPVCSVRLYPYTPRGVLVALRDLKTQLGKRRAAKREAREKAAKAKPAA